MSERAKTSAEERAEEAIAVARDIQAVAQMPGWRSWRKWIADGIAVRRARLEQLDCGERETDRVRGEIMLLRHLELKADASLDTERILAVEKELRSLREQADALHYVRTANQGNP